jgi:hypothetical protein
MACTWRGPLSLPFSAQSPSLAVLIVQILKYYSLTILDLTFFFKCPRFTIQGVLFKWNSIKPVTSSSSMCPFHSCYGYNYKHVLFLRYRISLYMLTVRSSILCQDTICPKSLAVVIRCSNRKSG